MLANIFTILADDKPLWVEMIAMLIPVGLAAWGFIRAYKAWEKQKKREIDLNLERQRYESKLAASRGIWPLLAYLSMWENDKTIFVKRKQQWYFRKDQAREYLLKLPAAFFEQGHGVFIPKDARDGLYEFRSIVYGGLLKFSDIDEGNEIKVNDPELPEQKVPKISQKINRSLKAMLVDSSIDFKE